MKTTPTANRRQFLSQCLRGAALLGASACTALPVTPEAAAGSGKSRVVVARDPLLRGAGTQVDPKRMAALVDRAVLAFFGLPASQNAPDAWRKIAKPTDTVSLKINTLGGRGISTNTALVDAICERLQQAGVCASNILVWDRDTAELERAGFRTAVGGDRVQCYGTDHVGYEKELSVWGSVGSRFSKILTRQTSVLINLPVLKDHDGAGVTVALKNMYGVIHNPNKYHPNGCNPYVADLNMLPEIRSRMRLSICDATTAMYEGGPGYKPEHSWKPNALVVAADPVALDWTGWQMIERKRRELKLKTLDADGRAPAYIATAADSDHRLGHADAARIETIEI
jgi:uncharacterized protein (DUF362 family)